MEDVSFHWRSVSESGRISSETPQGTELQSRDSSVLVGEPEHWNIAAAVNHPQYRSIKEVVKEDEKLNEAFQLVKLARDLGRQKASVTSGSSSAY
jgi:hypothetical protein